MPKEYSLNHKLISHYLSKEAKDDSEKVLIFSYWIAKKIKYDLNELKRFGYNKTPQETLLNKRGVCGCFSNLFHQFCINEGLKSFVVRGYSKGSIFKKIFTSYHLRHAWNVVYINHSWQLVDVTWAQSDLNSKSFKKSRELSWVFMAPEEFIKTHFPKIPVWQLLDRPYSFREFKKQTPPKSSEKTLSYENNILLDSSRVFANNYLLNFQYFEQPKRKKYFRDFIIVNMDGEFHTNDSLEIKQSLFFFQKLEKEIIDASYFFRKRRYQRMIEAAIRLNTEMIGLYEK
jgi:hypothetical protein